MIVVGWKSQGAQTGIFQEEDIQEETKLGCLSDQID